MPLVLLKANAGNESSAMGQGFSHPVARHHWFKGTQVVRGRGGATGGLGVGGISAAGTGAGAGGGLGSVLVAVSADVGTVAASGGQSGTRPVSWEAQPASNNADKPPIAIA